GGYRSKPLADAPARLRGGASRARPGNRRRAAPGYARRDGASGQPERFARAARVTSDTGLEQDGPAASRQRAHAAVHQRGRPRGEEGAYARHCVGSSRAECRRSLEAWKWACEQPTRSPVARVSQPPARPRARGARGRAGLWARRGSVHPRPEHSKKVAPPAGGGKRRLKEPHANPAPTPHDFWGGGRGSLRSGAPERSEPHPPPQKSWGVGVGFACGPP
ncbi:unnamed protein product, partial [Prorocentrum cordatum]